MANKRSETINRNKIYKTISYIVLAGLVLVGMVIGRVTKKAEVVTETVEVVKTVEVPVVESKGLPADNEVDYFNVPLSHSLQKFIYEICAEENVSVSLVIAMIEVESDFDPEIVSDTADTGLMQINECNYTELEEKYHAADLTNPYQNVFCGIKIISSYLEKYGDTTKALMCYNLGEYGAKKAWENGIYETEYTKKVLSAQEGYING